MTDLEIKNAGFANKKHITALKDVLTDAGHIHKGRNEINLIKHVLHYECCFDPIIEYFAGP